MSAKNRSLRELPATLQHPCADRHDTSAPRSPKLVPKIRVFLHRDDSEGLLDFRTSVADATDSYFARAPLPRSKQFLPPSDLAYPAQDPHTTDPCAPPLLLQVAIGDRVTVLFVSSDCS